MLPRVVTTFTFWIVGAPAIGSVRAAASSLSHVVFCFSTESGHRGRVVEDFVGRGDEVDLAATRVCRYFRKGSVHCVEDLEGAVIALARGQLPVLHPRPHHAHLPACVGKGCVQALE